jgi:omega-6 fatty acid desaturase (delta-12 desaturase)
MNIEPAMEEAKANDASWRRVIAPYQQPDERYSWWQLANSVIPYLALCYLAYRSLFISLWLTVPLWILAAGFLMRLFIIFHDCGHGSFFRSRRLNDIVGIVTGFFAFTPYYRWRHDHAVHHATAGDLDRRHVGDVWTMTVAEYLNAPLRTRIAYRVYRHPVIIFLIAPLTVFLIGHRFASRAERRRERNSVYWTNLALLALLVIMHFTIGLKAYILVQLPIMALAGTAGIWLFYVQHQFEGVYWQNHENWDYVSAALQGSSFYKLPRILQWFTGSIGFHHIHHLSPRIPNYRLEQCHNDNPLFQQVEPITLISSFRSMSFRLYDEENRRLVGFSYLKRLRLAPTASQA